VKLERLTLQNFRGFESLDITFDPSFTVILGGNMSGKTACWRRLRSRSVRFLKRSSPSRCATSGPTMFAKSSRRSTAFQIFEINFR